MHHNPEWLKTKAYLHLTPSLNISKNRRQYIQKITTPSYITRYAFYPLLYREIKQRRYKKISSPGKEKSKRAHSHRHPSTGKIVHSVKMRPIHFATHFDSCIYAYYAHLLKEKYEAILRKDPELDRCVTAYRSIPVSETDSAGKSNIHFAKEVFDEINARVDQYGQVDVLCMDLKSFFSSLSHSYLYKCWSDLLEKDTLPSDHQNVFNACTQFSYIMYDDLRQYPRGPFDEATLAKIRKKHGYRCFFSSNEEFRREIKEGRLAVYKNSFRKKHSDGSAEMIGIPQGLPISAVLANLYLLEFDRTVIRLLTKKEGAYYRRYSDDIIILAGPGKMDSIKTTIENLIREFDIEVSSEKTEEFIFRKMTYNFHGDRRITAIQKRLDRSVIDTPLTYLGFEFRGYNTLIKSANLAKYYRRLIYLIKSRARRANRASELDPTVPRAIYLNQIKKLYNAHSLRKDRSNKETKHISRRRYYLKVNDRGEFEFHPGNPIDRSSNYISYIRRCDRIFETDVFSRQLRKKNQIIGQAIRRHLIDKRK